MNVANTSTASLVTVSFNGAFPLTIKTNAGNNPVVGGLAAGMIIMGIVAGSTFRLVSDQASAAIAAAAEASATAAAASAAAAAASLMALRETLEDGVNPINSWRGYAELNSFNATGAAKSNVDGYLKLIASGASAQITLSGLAINGATERYLAVRYRRTVGTPGWDSDEDAFGWSTSGHSFSSSFLAKIVNTTSTWKTAYLDMWAPFAGGSDSKESAPDVPQIVTGPRFFAANGVGANIDIAWIATCADAPRRGDAQNDARFAKVDDKRFRDDELNLMMYSPSLTNGANVSAAIQSLLTDAAAAKKSAYIPAHPSGFDWRASTAISIPAEPRIIIGQKARVITSASINLFTCAGDNITFDGGLFGRITHDGAGQFLTATKGTASGSPACFATSPARAMLSRLLVQTPISKIAGSAPSARLTISSPSQRTPARASSTTGSKGTNLEVLADF
ncbi:hypothetical protein [Ensifer sp.]|jgi:hypothetical protein|uniref:hypothetical protein n=1 Tax=Ensifer sp. TaxID=1872086 RepID=UPI002E1500EE|nr:hypothetical protein [Ensifer sp.]